MLDDKKLFDAQVDALENYVNKWKLNCVVFLTESCRGFGKTTTINKIALDLISDGVKILVIGHKGVEYYCEKFESVVSINGRSLVGIGKEWIILVDEVTREQYKEIKRLLPNNLIYGFGKDYWNENLCEGENNMSMKDKHRNPYIDYVDESTPKVRFEEMELDWDSNVEREMGVIRGVNNRPCQVCGELSKFVDFCAEATVCSQQCQNAMNEGIYQFIKHMESCELE